MGYDDKLYTMIYINDGKTLIRKGRFSGENNLIFTPEDAPSLRMTKNPVKPLTVKNLKIFIEDDKDIIIAKYLLRKKYEDYVDRCRRIYEKSLNAEILHDESIKNFGGFCDEKI